MRIVVSHQDIARMNPSAQSKTRKPTLIDLFAGAGGTGLGFQSAGFEILAAIEIDRNSISTYQNNLNVTVTNQNIRDLSPENFRRSLGLKKRQLDVLVGCPPCQGFTRMRNDNGANDERNDLVLAYLEFVEELMPRYAVFENVPGLIRTRHGFKYYHKLCTGLEKLGFKVVKREVDTADYGVAQHRKRIIVLADRDGHAPPFPEPTHGDPRSIFVQQGALKPWRTVRDEIGNDRLPKLRAGQNGEESGKYPNHVASDTGEDVMRFITMVPHDGGSRQDVSKAYWLPCHKEHNGHRDVYGRMAWDRPSNTITTGCTNPSKGRFVHPDQDRAITAREAALLQGFPINYRFFGKSVSTQIGNAVPPPLAYAIAQKLKESL